MKIRSQYNQLRRQHPSPPSEHGIPEEHDLESDRYAEVFRILNEYREEQNRIEINYNISRVGLESSQRNSQYKTEEAITAPARSIDYEMMDTDRNSNSNKKNSQINRKAKLPKIIILEASLFLVTTDNQKAQAARLRKCNLTMIMNKTAIRDINWWITKLRANIATQLIQILSQMTMTTGAAPSGWDSALQSELEMIAIAHRSWNKRKVNITSSNRKIKAITKSLRSFANS
ncbi:MAG: hypothetical protein EZS28_024289 [Streblomastix strix]|uniref:Uncharacterized protein n=1 Tax=Streblomastix strix TaxID=222440 RepID=A0A5J4VCC5_9EUKA|nr:MAG: hypothetical protein EZS28_024289 [Streblomastix strix]